MRIVVHNYFHGASRRTKDDGWQENKHPRVSSGPNAGQFAKGAGGGSSGGDPHKIGPYFQNKYKPSENATHLAQQVASVSALKNQSTHYRNVVKMLLGDLEQYKPELHPDLYKKTEEKLKGKIVESLAIQKSNLIKKGEIAKAAKIDAKMIKWGVIPATPSASAPTAPAEPTKSPDPDSVPYASPEDLEKAKSTAPAVFYDVPEEAKAVVKAFNDRYAGKQLTSNADLAFKVEAFGYVKKFIAEAKEAQLQKQSEALKAITSALHASPEQAKAFAGLAQMVGGGGTANADDLIKKFQEFENEAKDYGYPISGFECALVKSYSDGTYGAVNAALRKGSWTEQTHAYNKVLNSALKKMPTFSGTVWRGANLDKKSQEAYVVGNIVEERAFTSTSANSNYGQTTKGNTRYVIQAKGRRAADIKKLSYHKSESEVLFQSRTFFKVTQVQGTPGGSMTVHMEEYWND